MREWLVELRKSKGYSQEFMGEKLGVTRQQYGYIENMDRQEELRLSVASKIVEIFGQKKITLKKIAEYEEALKEQSNETHSSI